MKQIYANNCTTLALGRRGENRACQVVFDVSDWEAEYGPGAVELIAQRPGDEKPYPVAVKRDGTQIIWEITSVETSVATQDRTGKCELRYYVGDVLAKYKPWRLFVDPAMDTPSETVPPDPEKGWVDQIIAVGAAAKASADAAKADADRAAALAAQAAEKADQTAQDASDAAKAMDAAQTAQRLAEEAQGAAEDARTAAAAAQAAAETAATDAAGAKQDAETALKSAQDAAAAAAKALADIRALYQEMQTWAQGVIQDVNAAGSAAVQSVQSAGDTQVQRVTDEGATQTANAKAQANAAAQSASGAAQSAQEAAESAAVYDDVVADVNQLKTDVAAITPDDTTVDGKPWTSKKIVDTICQPFEESGNPVQCYPVENYQLGVKVNWEPVQEGSGDPSPDNIRPITGRGAVSVTRCGKNLLDFSSFTNYTNWRMDIAAEGDAPTTALGNKGYILPVKPSKTYTISFEFLGDTFPTYLYIVKSINGVSKRYNYITTTIIQNKVVSFTPADNEIWYLRMGSTKTENLFNAQIEKITNIQLELGSTATPYEPYTGDAYDIALPETVYGGTLDVETGVVTVEWIEKVTQLGDTSLLSPVGNGFVRKNLPTTANAIIGKSNQKCNIAPYSYNYTGELTHFYIDTNGYAMIILPVDTPAETVIQTVCKVSVPYTIQLTPQQITALYGVNTIYTDADGVVVTGAEDPKHTITELKNAIISLGGNI